MNIIMEPNERHINIELISRYLSGEASSAEEQELKQWLSSSKENQQQFDEFRLVWENMESIAPVAGLDLDAEWDHQHELISRSSGSDTIRIERTTGKSKMASCPA